MNEVRDSERLLEHAVSELLGERQQLLTLFCELAAGENQRDLARLQRFCQLLIDYASLWQFEIHDLLLRRESAHPRARERLEELQPVILGAADVALDFNDRYDASDHRIDLAGLPGRLSRLGEALATRFDAEDRVISAL